VRQKVDVESVKHLVNLLVKLLVQLQIKSVKDSKYIIKKEKAAKLAAFFE
jgi:hypothetical protein